MEYGLIGEHLSHSFSKEIHESLGGYLYELKEISKEDLDAFMKSKSFKAINVTIPYKEKVIPYLDEILDEAKATNAVNCVINQCGKLIGYNTDVYGFEALLKFADIDVKNKVVLILGDGGASKAVNYVLNKLNAKNILFASRKNLKNSINYNDLINHQEIEIIINTTPVGMYPNNDDELIDIDIFKKLEAYVDVIYNPIRTRNVIKAELKGIKAIGGLYMLVAQAVRASEIFLNTTYNEEIIKEIYLKIKNKKSNIVLIGMPSSGKSTIGEILSKIYEYKYIDIDEEIIKEINMPIKDYFVNHDESSFRKIEKNIVNNICQNNSTIISTGGGTILDIENVIQLKQNGILIFLDRNLEKLEATSSRPLSSSKSDLEALYQKRLPLYKKYADIIIDNNSTLDIVIERIREYIK